MPTTKTTKSQGRNASEPWKHGCYEWILPFTICEVARPPLEAPEPFAVATRDRPSDWTTAQAQIAEAALERGYRLYLDCKAGFVAETTARICHQVTTPILAWYDWKAQRLIIAHENEEEIRSMMLDIENEAHDRAEDQSQAAGRS